MHARCGLIDLIAMIMTMQDCRPARPSQAQLLYSPSPHVIWVPIVTRPPEQSTIWYSPLTGKEASCPHSPGSCCLHLCCFLGAGAAGYCSYMTRTPVFGGRKNGTLRFSGGWAVSDCACCCAAAPAVPAHLRCCPAPLLLQLQPESPGSANAFACPHPGFPNTPPRPGRPTSHPRPTAPAHLPCPACLPVPLFLSRSVTGN